MKNNKPVPIIMYHSVGIPNNSWRWNYLTCPFYIFEKHLNSLNNFGFKTITLKELYNYIFNNGIIPDKAIVLSFDDGYVDNWVFAFPLLKKYNMKGVIFVNPDFIDKRNIRRKRLDEIENINDIKSLDTLGFLSWEEITEMEKSGLIDIQSHAMTHTWYNNKDEIVDFRHPNDKYIWMTWNDHIDMKPYLQIDNQDLIKLGEPVYLHEKSLSSRRYIPDRSLSEFLVKYVECNGKELFFKNNDWRKELINQVEIYRSKNRLIQRIETEEEYFKRIKLELSLSKILLENKLENSIEFLCWPGGSATAIGNKIAMEIGYLMTSTARDIPDLRDKIKNCPPQEVKRFNRIAPNLFWNGKEDYNAKIIYMNGLTLMMIIYAFRGSIFLNYCQRVIKVIVYKYLKLKNGLT